LFTLFPYISLSTDYLIDNTRKIGENIRQKMLWTVLRHYTDLFSGGITRKQEKGTDLGTLYPVEIRQSSLKLIAVQVL